MRVGEQFLEVTGWLLNIIRLLASHRAIQCRDVASGADGNTEGVRYHGKDPLGESLAAELDDEDCRDTDQRSSQEGRDG